MNLARGDPEGLRSIPRDMDIERMSGSVNENVSRPHAAALLNRYPHVRTEALSLPHLIRDAEIQRMSSPTMRNDLRRPLTIRAFDTHNHG